MALLFYLTEWLMKNCFSSKQKLLGPSNTVITKVTFVPINQESHATNRYLAGDLDITEIISKQRYQKLLKDIPNEVFTPDQLGTYYYAFNTQRAPTDDVRVKSLIHALTAN